MYIRFVSKHINEQSNSLEGVFYAIWGLLDEGELEDHEIVQVDKSFDWFGMHFKAPACLTDPENKRAICWFKESATEPMKRIWPLIHVLEQHGIHIDKIKSVDPGVIIYESGWQAVAKPYKKNKTYSKGKTPSKYQQKRAR